MPRKVVVVDPTGSVMYWVVVVVDPEWPKQLHAVSRAPSCMRAKAARPDAWHSTLAACLLWRAAVGVAWIYVEIVELMHVVAITGE